MGQALDGSELSGPEKAMGWMWSDSPKQNVDPTAPVYQRYTKDEAIQTSPTTPPAPIPQSPKRPLTRDELAEAELQDLLNEINAPSEPPPSSHASRPPLPLPHPFSPPETDSSNPSSINHSSIAPNALYPTTMSCRQAFDSAFYCQSLGGQFTNLYRYGTMRNCSDQWSNFWFCMRTNRGGMGEEDRKKRIQQHYRGRARKYVTGPSSEDVWAVREEAVVEAFEGDFEKVEEGWRQEMERVRLEREG